MIEQDKTNNQKANKKKRKILGMLNASEYFNDGPNPKLIKVGALLNTIFFVVTIIVYIILGAVLKLWAKTWMIIIFWPVIPSIFSAIGRGKFCSFMIPFLAVGIYLAIGMNISGGWHPYWAILLIIPVYYLIFAFVDKKLKQKREDKKQENEKEGI